VSENTPPPTYQVGDVVNGFRLTATNDGLQWLPADLSSESEEAELTRPVKRRSIPTWGWVGLGIASLAVVALIAVGAIAVLGSSNDERGARPVASAESRATAAERAKNLRPKPNPWSRSPCLGKRRSV
jgi:hypothetical protein